MAQQQKEGEKWTVVAEQNAGATVLDRQCSEFSDFQEIDDAERTLIQWQEKAEFAEAAAARAEAAHAELLALHTTLKTKTRLLEQNLLDVGAKAGALERKNADLEARLATATSEASKWQGEFAQAKVESRQLNEAMAKLQLDSASQRKSLTQATASMAEQMGEQNSMAVTAVGGASSVLGGALNSLHDATARVATLLTLLPLEDGTDDDCSGDGDTTAVPALPPPPPPVAAAATAAGLEAAVAALQGQAGSAQSGSAALSAHLQELAGRVAARRARWAQVAFANERRVAVNNFCVGDLVLFLPSADKSRYLAFHPTAPATAKPVLLSKICQDLIGSDPAFTPAFVLGRIVMMEEKVAGRGRGALLPRGTPYLSAFVDSVWDKLCVQAPPPPLPADAGTESKAQSL